MGHHERNWPALFIAAAALLVHPPLALANDTPGPVAQVSETSTGNVQATSEATHAVGETAIGSQEARDAFWNGYERFEAGDYEAALKFFEESYALSSHPEIAFNIAMTHEQLGHCEQALATYEEFLARAGSAPQRSKVIERRDDLAMRCKPQTALTPSESKAPEILPAPAPVLVPEAAPPGPASEPETGSPAALLQPSPAPHDTAASELSIQQKLGWAALGVAVVSLGATAYFEVKRRQAYDDYVDAERDYNEGGSQDAGDRLKTAEKGYNRLRSLPTTFGIVSGAAALGGSILLLYQPPAAAAQNGTAQGFAAGLQLGVTGRF